MKVEKVWKGTRASDSFIGSSPIPFGDSNRILVDSTPVNERFLRPRGETFSVLDLDMSITFQIIHGSFSLTSRASVDETIEENAFLDFSTRTRTGFEDRSTMERKDRDEERKEIICSDIVIKSIQR
ncbi:hypothetical protein K0M31_003927 [Melipona bicolor]|uniref:Uncharacterized protein n=1 Tax=Melipona bicolor TaxID=60889 RepID=A0AA40FYT8_9HYME|nr:hypothetical protein K0M31_003927 [Melipona bicolor]